MERAQIQDNFTPKSTARATGARAPEKGRQEAKKADGVPLGSTLDFASFCESREAVQSQENHLDFRVIRWALQAAARELLPPSSGISYCLRTLLPDSASVEVWRHDESGRAHYKNLCVCAGVWVCAPCSDRISEGRRQELKQATELSEQYSFTMATFTISHRMIIEKSNRKDDRAEPLAPLVNDLLAAYRLITSGEAYQTFKSDSGIVGSIKSLECTYSDRNGFHPHLHVLIVTPRGSRIDRDWMKDQWQAAIGANARAASLDRGCVFSEPDMTPAEYIEKYGRERIKDRWGISGEMTGGARKMSRSDSGYSMFQCLFNTLTAPTEKQRAKWRAIFKEYAGGFKGKSQLRYSQGLRDLLGLKKEVTDKELAEGGEHPSSLLATLSVRQWRIVLAHDARGEILSAAEKGILALDSFLDAIGASRNADDDIVIEKAELGKPVLEKHKAEKKSTRGKAIHKITGLLHERES